VLKLTLDTNCIIAGAQGEPNAVYVDQLAELARAGRVTISITSGFGVDQRTASPERRQANLAYLASMPVVHVPGQFRFNVSFLDGEDVLTDDETADLDKLITEMVSGGKVTSKKINDVHHLTAHWMARNDIFVTSDDHDVVKKRERLRVEAGIVVKTPAETVSLVAAARL
jgi:hypothetical protein